MTETMVPPSDQALFLRPWDTGKLIAKITYHGTPVSSSLFTASTRSGIRTGWDQLAQSLGELLHVRSGREDDLQAGTSTLSHPSECNAMRCSLWEPHPRDEQVNLLLLLQRVERLHFLNKLQLPGYAGGSSRAAAELEIVVNEDDAGHFTPDKRGYD